MSGLVTSVPSRRPVAPQLPRRGQVKEQSARQPDDLILHSVTACLDVLDKSRALMQWAVNVTAERAIDRLHLIRRRLEEEGRESAIDYVKGLRWDQGGNLSDSALGTLAHSLFDTYALDGRRPQVVRDMHPEHAGKGKLLSDEDVLALTLMLDQFDRFLQRFQPDYLACETVVGHETYAYAGQCDTFLTIEGVPLIGDYKTSRTSWTAAGREKKPYPEAGLQLAAYRHAEFAAVWRARRYENRSRRFYLLNADERAAAVPVPEVDGGVVIHVTPHRYGVFPARCGDREFGAFLYTLECARWLNGEASHVIGDEMVPPFGEATDDGDPFEGLPGEL
jgi:hypothetical protein